LVGKRVLQRHSHCFFGTNIQPLFVSCPIPRGDSSGSKDTTTKPFGVGRIYHLFRLPIGLEQASADALNDAAFVQTVQARLANRELALARLAELAGKAESASPGPVSLGQMSQDLKAELQRAAGFYWAAFTSGIQTFPYVREVE